MVPTTSSQPVRGPDAILCNELGKEFGFGQRPGLPDRADYRRPGTAQQLCPIGRGRSINPGGREFPSNTVVLAVIQVNVAYHVPQVCELYEVLGSEPRSMIEISDPVTMK